MKQGAMFLMIILLAASVAVAEGDAAVNQAAAEKPVAAEAAPTEHADQASPLDELEWLIGNWIDEGEGSTIHTRCAWAKNRKFLTRSFAVTIEGEPSLEGTQVIGWDPIAQRIRSWTFDSEGGFGEAYWLRDGSRWLVKTKFVLATGERASCVNVITYVDPDTLRWQSIAREIDGEVLPNVPEATIVRQKPAPEAVEATNREVSQ